MTNQPYIYHIYPCLCIPIFAPRKSHVACFPARQIPHQRPATHCLEPSTSFLPHPALHVASKTRRKGAARRTWPHSAAHRLPLPQPRPLRPRPSVAPASDDPPAWPRWRPPSVPPPPLRRRGLASRSSKALPLPRHRHARRPARTTAARCLFLSPVSDFAARLALFFYSVPWSGHRRRIDPSSCSPCHHRQRRPPPVIHR